jgi:transposase
MTTRDINNWIMYHEIHQLFRNGFKKSKIASYLSLDVRTVERYLSMSETQLEQFLQSAQNRKRVLAPYKAFVREHLEKFQDTSAAQMHDWLKEHYLDFPDVSPRTVYNFVVHVRQQYSIPFVKQERDYMPVDELPYGQQAQVDFGEYNMRTPNGNRKKVHFFAIVLSRSRMKFVWFVDRPFTAHHVCLAHEKSFGFLGGVPKEIVYDLDRAMVVNENLGEIILTKKFKDYVAARSFSRHFCRKADPESKGKVENVVKYVKQNFLYNRAYYDIETLNHQALGWLSRTANLIAHSVTKKSPADEHRIEVSHLNPYTPLLLEDTTVNAYQVRKDNTIAYRSNFYSLPIGTYKGSDSKVFIKEYEGSLEIYDLQQTLLCTHLLSIDKGRVIVNTNHKRDRSETIKKLIESALTYFTDKEAATEYFQHIRSSLPRYIRDHLQVILKTLQRADWPSGSASVADETLKHCMEHELYHGYDFEKVFWVNVHESESRKATSPPIKPLNTQSQKMANQKPDKSNIDDYQQIFNP